MSEGEHYMRARMALNEAMENFISEAYRVGFPQYKIAGDILDSMYDADSEIYTSAQCELLPMVEKFHLTKSLDSAEMVEDWGKAIIRWEQMKMWKVMNG